VKIKKRAISLIETLICLTLVAVLLSTLSVWYASINSQKIIFDKLKGPLMEERYAFQRLQWIFPSAKYLFSSTHDQSLSFIFDRGTFEVPKLSGKVLGKLYFDSANHCLSLCIWPLPQKENLEYNPTQTFILLDSVEKCHFEFYNPPDPFQQPVDPQKVGRYPTVGWQKEWLSDYCFIPALVKICIKRQEADGKENRSLEYIFDLPVSIIYPEEKV
jgi:Protein of unknown function (DUF1494)